MGWTVVVVLGALLFGAGAVRYRMGPGGRDMLAAQLQKRLGQADCIVLDVRSDREYRSGYIPGALHIPHTRIGARLDELEPHRDRSIVVYCAHGVRARMAQNTLRKAGFEDVYHLVGDMPGWQRDGLAVELASVP